MTNEELPLLSEVIEAYERGEIKKFDGIILCKMTENNIPSPLWYNDIVTYSDLNKKWQKDIVDIMWSNKEIK